MSSWTSRRPPMGGFWADQLQHWTFTDCNLSSFHQHYLANLVQWPATENAANGTKNPANPGK